MKSHIINKTLSIVITMLTLLSCSKEKDLYDASGTFEAEETIISAEGTGRLVRFDLEEGQEVKTGQILGFIDSTQLYLKKVQLLSQIRSTLSQRPNVNTQIAALKVQLQSAEHEQKRVANLVKAQAATQKQLDDMDSNVEMIRKQLEAQQSALGITSESITEQTSPLKVQIQQLEDQLDKCKVVNPINGTILTKYAEVNEMTSIGKPLYKIADLNNIILRAYITGDQLGKIKLNQRVNVLVDDGAGTYKTWEGVLTWVSNKAEFTPKTIQTKQERANLVYATKISVKNDGTLKLGMYAEVKF